MKIALIDADSFAYLIGWNFKPKDTDDEFIDSDEEKQVRVISQTDEMVNSILLATEATHYLGALGHPSIKCFRQDAAKFKEYKGHRKPDDPTIAKWKGVIKQRLFDHWGFIAVGGLEADDVISLAAGDFAHQNYQMEQSLDQYPHPRTKIEVTIASIDKDLRQIPGRFYDYKKLEWADIDLRQSIWLFWYQMIVGDPSDEVAGIPKKGDVAAHKALDPLLEQDDYATAMEACVRGMYFAHFGNHYGQTIFEENKAVLGMMTKDHPYYEAGYLAQCLIGIKEHKTTSASSAF